jgi:hypothetical protein
MAKRLNIPNKEDKFAEVDFVEKMTPYQMKVLIKNIWANLGELANVTDTNRPDISRIIDTMRDGGTWNKKQVRERYRCVYLNGIIAQYDSMNDQFIFSDGEGNIVQKESMNLKDFKRFLNKELKG